MFEHQQCHVFHYLVIEGGFAPLYKYIVTLGALSLKQRAKRWLASCGFDRGIRAGKREQPNAGRM